MAYQKYQNKQEFFLERVSMTLGSLANLYSNSANPPTPNELYEKAVELTDKMWKFGKRFDSFPELDEKLKERFKEEHTRTIGRYSASELWGFLNGKIPPQKFLEPPKYTQDAMRRMYWGTIIHKGIQKIFNFDEKKYEIEVAKGIKIICKIDLELEDEIYEFKTREDIESFDNVPSWYNYQCQCYLEAKDKEEMKLFLFGWGFTRKLFIVKRDRYLFKKIIVPRLIAYHKQVVAQNSKQNSK